MIKQLSKIFFRGLLTLLPILVTFTLLVWLVLLTEDLFGRTLWPESIYFPGLGIFIGIIVAFCIGLLMSAKPLRKLVEILEEKFSKLPLIKHIYGPTKEVMQFFLKPGKEGLNKVVLVDFPQFPAKALGFVTREDLSIIYDKKRIAVFFPMSYQIGGYTLFLEEKQIEEINMTVEDAMRFIFSGGVVLSKKTEK